MESEGEAGYSSSGYPPHPPPLTTSLPHPPSPRSTHHRNQTPSTSPPPPTHPTPEPSHQQSASFASAMSNPTPTGTVNTAPADRLEPPQYPPQAQHHDSDSSLPTTVGRRRSESNPRRVASYGSALSGGSRSRQANRSGSFMGSLGQKLRKEKYYAGTVPILVKRQRGPIGRQLDRFNSIDILGKLFAPEAVTKEPRSVVVNERLPPEAYLAEGQRSGFFGFGAGKSQGAVEREKVKKAEDLEKDAGSGTSGSDDHTQANGTGNGSSEPPGPGQLDRRTTMQTLSMGADGKPRKVAPAWHYTSNQVITSKYNIITFLPRNLLEQFRRIANVFFLVLVILQFFPRFTNVSPALAALPLLVVLFITALKDAYEDYKRHESDRRINNLSVKVLSGEHWRNRNHTKSKQRSVTIRGTWLWKLFGGKAGKGGDPSVAGENVRDESDEPKIEDDRSSIGDGKKKHWWGARKRKVNRSTKSNGAPPPPAAVTAPGGGDVAAAVAKGEEEDVDPISRSKYYDDDVPQTYVNEGIEGVPAAGPDDIGTARHRGLHLPRIGTNKGEEDKLRPHWEDTTWEELRVGDFVLLKDDEAVPADMVVCATSEEEDVCYVETKNLDGETNLKARHAVPELATRCRNAAGCAGSKFAVNGEAPDVNMFRLNAAVEFDLDGEVGGRKKVPITLNTMLLRGTVVRNTKWAIGLVIYTGRDSKIVMNSGGTPSKRSKVERQMNPMVFLNLALLAAACVFCAVGTVILENYYYDRNSYWTVGENLSDDNPNFNGLISFFNAMITFQNIVPISLYISIEFVRTTQAFFIWSDDHLCHDLGGAHERRTLARSWNLSDDLGQIEYIFSDKTGTLTQNAMEFKQCSIGAVKYIGDDKPAPNTITDEKVAPTEGENGTAEGQSDTTRQSTNSDASTSHVLAQNADAEDHGSSEPSLIQTRLPPEVLNPFHSSELLSDLAQTQSAQSQRIHGFMLNLALCHSVLAAEDNDKNIIYKAQSPDEAALVQAAADVGFVFLGREKNKLSVQMPKEYGGAILEWELLNVIEFSSARKRMSVFVKSIPKQGEEPQLLLLCKGADNIIKERLAQGQEEIWQRTDEHLAEFANDGLRTLCLAYKVLPEDFYNDWAERYHEASVAIDDREEKMEVEADRVERDLQLLGATAIEDRLQDGVPEAIADFKTAGIKVWVATGDKLETAVAIGYSSNLLAPDMNLIVIRGGPYDPEKKSAYSQLRRALVEFFDGEELVNNLVNQPPVPASDDIDGDAEFVEAREGQAPPPPSRSQRLQRSDTGVSVGSDVVGANNGARAGGYGLVIDGASLTHAFNEPFTKEILLELATRCEVVICCRTSPLQKALIVKLVKDGLGAMSLAIGDGANDVSMIQAADVGVGVAGEEGLQAVNSSDYAIGQFRFLKRLLLVHGHWSYVRNSNMIVNFFEKEIIGIGILFWFQFYCAYSTTTVYEYTYLLFWNVFWTLVPVIVLGATDRNIDQRVLMEVPQLYHYGRRGKLFGLLRFSLYMLDGIYQSAVCYWFILYTYDTVAAASDGYEVNLYSFSTVMAISAVFVTNIYIGLNTYAWTWWWVFGVVIGPLLILVYTAFYSAISPGWIWTFVYGNNHYLWPTAYFWFTLLFTILLALAPRYLYKYWQTNYWPTDIDILREVHRQHPKHNFAKDARIHPHVGHNRSASSLSLPAHPGLGHRSTTSVNSGMRRTITRMSGDEDRDDLAGGGFAFDAGGRLRVHRERGSRFGSLRRGSKTSNGEGADSGRPRSGSFLSKLGLRPKTADPQAAPATGSTEPQGSTVPEPDRPRTPQ